MIDLGRATATGRLSAEAFNRSVKEQAEATQLAALNAKRYEDNMGSLTAGFEAAALQYARANDLFSQGGQIFNATVNFMNEGLDALAGKSNKTFGQILGDFARMLQQMAIRAAASAIFSKLFGAGLDPTASLTTDQQIAVFSSYKATGGDVYPNQSYLVGEHGPERFVPTVAGAIVPMQNGGGPSVAVNVDMSGSSGGATPRQAAEFARRMKQAVLDTINDEKRPGGSLYAGAR
jgi:phage-related minor tail protein